MATPSQDYTKPPAKAWRTTALALLPFGHPCSCFCRTTAADCFCNNPSRPCSLLLLLSLSTAGMNGKISTSIPTHAHSHTHTHTFALCRSFSRFGFSAVKGERRNFDQLDRSIAGTLKHFPIDLQTLLAATHQARSAMHPHTARVSFCCVEPITTPHTPSCFSSPRLPLHSLPFFVAVLQPSVKLFFSNGKCITAFSFRIAPHRLRLFCTKHGVAIAQYAKGSSRPL